MKCGLIISLLLVSALNTFSQVIFRTIVPKQPVIAGESFPVQYVLEDGGQDIGFTPPLFNGLRVVSGPDTYDGHTLGPNGPIALRNIVFTLVAPKPGWLTIPGATAMRNGHPTRSNDVLIEVISQEELRKRTLGDLENGSEYLLKPGEDPYQKMKDNLFLRVSVDRQQCFVGQPVLATFKLYSRLESRSDIVKNPGFYGFTVHDILNLNDRHSVTEVINGKAFDVHTVRMVQLYPLQAGDFVIDPMEVVNQVEFSRSVVNRKTEQKIVEGIFEKKPLRSTFNTVSYENTISTKPVSIRVKPLPEKNKPTAFDGATGEFSISSSFESSKLSRNEKGILLITYKGHGNFVQLDAPRILWPEGIEGFAPTVQDSLDKSFSPLRGSRTFRFPFVASKKGSFTIPSVSLTYFNPDSNHYKTVKTEDLQLPILDEKQASAGNTTTKTARATQSNVLQWMLIALGVIILSTIFLRARQRRHLRKKQAIEEEKHRPVKVSIDDEFMPAIEAFRMNDASFYSILMKCTATYLDKSLQVPAGRMNREKLNQMLHKRNVPAQYIDELSLLLGQCEMANFTQAEPTIGKRRLLFRMKEVLRKIC